MATNTILTTQAITDRALAMFLNTDSFLQKIDRQYESMYAVRGAKIGAALRIRLPNDFVVRTGAVAAPQSTQEKSTTLVISTMKGVDLSFDSTDRTLSMDDYAVRVIDPAVNALSGEVAVDIMKGSENLPNIVRNVDAGGATISPSYQTWAGAGALLTRGSTPRERRHVIMDPITEGRTVGTLAGLFNPQQKISQAFNTAMVPDGTLGNETWSSDQSVIQHTTGTFVSGTVNGTAGQTGNTIGVTSTTGIINAGDIITFAGVYGVNRVQKQTNTGTLAQFVVTVAAPAGSTTLTIYPALTPPVAGNAVPYQTVSASPAAGAAIGTASPASETYKKNFIFHPTAATMACADLELPRAGIISGARRTYHGLSLRMIEYYVGDTDVWAERIDFLYGSLWTRPEWAVIVADTGL